VDTQRFSPTPQGWQGGSADPGPLRVGFVGALAVHKGVDTLIEAVGGLRTPFVLSIAGDGPDRPRLEVKANTSPAASRIRFRGRIPNAELPDFLRTLDVLVVPSITMPNWNEQFGRIIIEAMACAVPVIGSTCGSIPEIVGEGGVVFPERDAGELRTTLESLATDRSALQGLSQRARQRVLEHFSWERVAPRILKIYLELLENTT
jgi:glycosyltransferase involved in cell wall biosynthesis